MKHAVILMTAIAAFAATAYDTIPSWTLTWTNAANTVGTLVTDAAHGGWTLNVRKDSSYGGYGLLLGIYSGTAFHGSAVASGGGETGELDMRGTITGPTLDGTGTTNAWKIAYMQDSCLRTNGNGSPALAVKILRTPGTLVSGGLSCFYHNDSNPKPNVTEVYVDEPNVTGSIPSWLCSGCTSLQKLVLKVPQATSLSTYIAHWQTPRSVTSYDDYDLTSVKTVYGNTGSGGAMQGWEAVGTLDLPSLETVTSSNAFQSVRMGAVLLGTKGNLKSIGERSFLSCNSISNIVLGASPSGVTLELKPSAFNATGIKRVWFCGSKAPNIVQKAGTYTFGGSATAEGVITFYVPDTPGWADVLAQRDANGLVPASVFNTANRQYVRIWNGCVYHDSTAGHVVDTVLAETYGDQVQVTTGAAEDTSGFPYATAGRNLQLLPLVFTASTTGTPDAQGRTSAFYRWGGVPAAREQENPLVLTTADDVNDVRAFFAHDWTYDATAQTIANGNWVINVSVVDSGQRTLRIGKNSNNPADGTYSTAFTGTGHGTLDFNGHVRDSSNNEWTLVTMRSYAMCRARKWLGTDTTATLAVDHPEVIVFPQTLTSMDHDVFNFNQSQNWPLREVVLIAPNVASFNWVVNGPILLKRMTLRIPKVTAIDSNFLWQNASLADTDVTDWDLSGVQTVGTLSFGCSTGMRGTLKLPSLVSLGNRNFQEHKSLDGVVLATNLTLTTVGSNAFLNATALKSVTIGNAKSGVTIGQNSFKGATGLKSVTFLGPRNETLADAVLTGVAATTGAKSATVYASRALEWVDSVSAATGDEVAAKPTSAAGVYRDGSRKAWLEYAPSPFDPRGTLMIVR